MRQVPEIAEALARQVVRVTRSIRDLDLKKSPSIAETLDWARTLVQLSVQELSDDVVRQTLPVLLKYQSDLTKASGHLRVATDREA